MKTIPGEEFVEIMLERNYEFIIEKCWEGLDLVLAHPDPSELRQLYLALLRSGRLKDAITCYTALIDWTRPDMRNAHDYSELAAAYWLQAHRTKGDYEETVTNLRRALKCNYGDGAKNMTPALLLYYVAIRIQDQVLKQEAVEQIQAKLETGWAKNWPAPLGRFLVGVEGEDHVEEELANEHPLRQPDERCRFNFYRGVKFLEKEDEDNAKACFRLAVDDREQKTWTAEFVFARDELGETPNEPEKCPV